MASKTASESETASENSVCVAESAMLNTMIRGIPGDVAVELDRRARENFRCRNSEMVAILTTVCRKKIKLPLVQLSELEVAGENLG